MSLKTANLSKRFKDKWVLRNVSIDAEAGEVFGVFGPSGSGKSVLLDAIAGELPLNGGSVNSSDIATAKRRPSLWSRIFGSNGSSVVSVDDAIANAKSVLLLDEPCLYEANARSKQIEKIRTAAGERGLVVILASSDYSLMLEACDRVAILVGGEIRQVGTPQEVYEQPASRIVASVTGPNNLFAARRLTSSKAEIPEFHTIDGGHRLFAQRIDRSALGALNQNVTLGIRPENISISFGASFPADNLLKATVARIRFLGSTTMIGLDADGLSLNVLVLHLVGLNTGDECMVGLPPERILIFRD